MPLCPKNIRCQRSLYFLLTVLLLISSPVVRAIQEDSNSEVKLNVFGKINFGDYKDCERAKKLIESLKDLNKFKDNLHIINRSHAIIKIATENNCQVLLGYMYYWLGSYLMQINQYASGYGYLLKSKEMLSTVSEDDVTRFNAYFDMQVDREHLLNIVLFDIGVIEVDNGEFESARQRFNKLLVFFESIGDRRGVIDCKLNLYSIYVSEKLYEKGRKNFKKLLKDAYITTSDSSLVLYNIAISYMEEKKVDSACPYIDKAIEIAEKLENYVQLPYLYDLKADVEKYKNNFQAEQTYLIQSLEGANTLNDYEYVVDIYNRLAQSTLMSGDYDKTGFWMQKYNKLKDSLTTKQSNSVIEKVRIENLLNKQIALNNTQRELLTSQKRYNNLLFWLFLMSAFIVVLMVYGIIATKKNHYKKIKLIEEELKAQSIELRHKKLTEEMKSRQLEAELNRKNRERMLISLLEEKREKHRKQIIKKIAGIKEKSIITKKDMDDLMEYINAKSEELSKKKDINIKLSNMNPNWLGKLTKDFPALTKTELRVLSFIYIGLDTKEIAGIQFVTVEAVRKMRYRIRKKLGLKPNESLEKFIMQY